jgi:hypothetical protein
VFDLSQVLVAIMSSLGIEQWWGDIGLDDVAASQRQGLLLSSLIPLQPEGSSFQG